MKYFIHSHNKAQNKINISDLKNVLYTINSTKVKLVKGCSVELRRQILDKLRILGWTNNFNIDANSRITLTASYKNYALCLQTGNMSRFYADLLKLQYLYTVKGIKAALYIIPTKELSAIIGSNIANYERFKQEITIFKQILTLPILVIGIKK